MKHWLGALIGIALFASSASADSISALRERTNAGTVGVVSGGLGGTYIRIAAELAAVLDDDQLRVLPLVGKGSVQNIADIMFLKGVDVGIVQSDVLAYLRKEKLYPGVEKSIEYIVKLYNEELHLLVGNDIASVADLAGKKINFDVKNSGTAMTAGLVFERLNIRVEPTYYDQNLALDKLQKGEIAGLVYVAGKPATLFKGLSASDGMHLLALPTESLTEGYLPSQFTHADYPNLVGDGQTIDTVAVGAVMAVYGWPRGTDRYKKVARFVDAFLNKFPAFLESSRHPKWREVNLNAQVPGWTRFGPADDWLKRDAVARKPRQEFDSFLSLSGQSFANLSMAQRDALFQQFVHWQQTKPQ